MMELLVYEPQRQQTAHDPPLCSILVELCLVFPSPSALGAAAFGIALAKAAALGVRLTDVALSDGYCEEGEFTRAGLVMLAAAALPRCPRLSLHLAAPRGSPDGVIIFGGGDDSRWKTFAGLAWARAVAALPVRLRDRVRFSQEPFEGAMHFNFDQEEEV